MVTVEPLTEAASNYVASHLRKADIQEIRAFGINNVAVAAEYSRSMSTLAWAALDRNGVPFCSFGVSPVSVVLGHGSPWLLGTDEILNNQLPFLRQSSEYVDRMLDRYSYLRNYVYEDNDVSQRWLRWLGFEIHDAVPLGLHGEQFNLFSRRAQ